MTTLQTIVAGAGADVLVNENFDSMSPAALYGVRKLYTTGLTFAYYGGISFGNTVADGTITLTNSATNYIVASRSTGAVSSSTSTTNWNDSTNYMRLYVAVAASGAVGYTDHREAYGGGAGGGGSFTGGTLSSALNEAPPVTIASATAPSAQAVGAAAANTIIISGTTTQTGFDTIAAGAIRRTRFSGVLQLTHNATSFILPGSANITTAVGDVATWESLGSGNWRCIGYARADGTAVVGATGAAIGSVNVFTKNQSVAAVSLTSGGTIAVDASLSNNFKLVLATNATLSNPTNPTDGMVVNIRIKQDGTGSRTLAYGSAYKWPGGTAPTLSTAANAVDLISMYYDSADAVWACAINKAFS